MSDQAHDPLARRMVYEMAEKLCENMKGSNFRYVVRGKTFTAERRKK